MKAVFKKTALDRLLEVIQEAMRMNRKIDYILVTPEEMSELRDDCRGWSYMNCDYRAYYAGMSPQDRANIRYVELRDSRGRPARFCMSSYQVSGCDIVEAPAEFH